MNKAAEDLLVDLDELRGTSLIFEVASLSETVKAQIKDI